MHLRPKNNREKSFVKHTKARSSLKMKIEVKIISEECIKPSSPTPPNLKTYKLCVLDQFTPPIHIPMILFYSNQLDTNNNLASNHNIISKRSQLLKQSLSETLTHFYPLAGKINKNNLSVDCNDEGVYYVEARANIPLSEYLIKPDLKSMNNNLLPSQTNWFKLSSLDSKSYITMMQETTFSCGSIAIGVLVLHVLIDGNGLVSFLKAWANATKSSTSCTISVYLDAASIFPQHDAFPKDASATSFWELVLRTGKLATGRLVFEASAIASLKEKVTTSTKIVQYPTRVETVSAFLEERIMAVLKERLSIDDQRQIASIHAVNLRKRAIPPFPESSLGNLVWMPLIMTSLEETKLPNLVCKIREGIRKIDSNFIKSIQGNEGFYKLYEDIKEIRRQLSRGVEYLAVSSWANFDVYDADFGWGRPSWVSCVGLASGDSDTITQFVNAVVLMDASIEKGIEVWMFMDEEEIAMLEKDKELLTYASINPNPLKLLAN